ncbi:hypothetical protein BTZ20_4117 [Rhodococcus sp. MTM3W5.2]|uniref:hypothetical protein n=1 Tax=Rhodococcus sp. MTM3W5.2 TaxID=1805827 RepID=UPI0009796C66|nr:hypothetical protein [Rhodococcus sp. MTM3W5.2]AQA24516.1 hypothetical protein BTZ20_4117 [Rhodococcus sp. MTM3W5.2]
MSPTVSQVKSWNVHALRTTAEGIASLVAKIDAQVDCLTSEQDALAETWHGTAATAAAGRVVQEQRLGRGVFGALAEVADEYRMGAGIVEAARDHLVAIVAGAHARGYRVGDTGEVDPSGLLAMIALAPPGMADIAAIRIQKEAADLTIAVVGALRQANAAATDAAGRIQGATAALQRAGDAAVPGKVVEEKKDIFTWKPDVPATVAASSIGVVADATKAGLVGAATSSADDVARTIGRGLGPFWTVVGTVPAVVNDIDGGMDPTKAIVSEGVGAGAGLWLGTTLGSMAGSAAAGSAAGSVVPGLGTVVGLVVGAGVGAATGYAGSKGIQWVWD